MSFKLTIETDNAAFHPEEEDGQPDPFEVVAILDQVSIGLLKGKAASAVLDSNGNQVGSYELTSD